MFFSTNPQPTISANVYANSTKPSGGVGKNDTFTFSFPFSDTATAFYHYVMVPGLAGNVTADPNAQTATLPFRPIFPGRYKLTVTALDSHHTTTSCAAVYLFTVAVLPTK